jgi:hypothetical protein
VDIESKNAVAFPEIPNLLSNFGHILHLAALSVVSLLYDDEFETNSVMKLILKSLEHCIEAGHITHSRGGVQWQCSHGSL